MDKQYDKNKIRQNIVRHIEKFVDEPFLQRLALESVDFKYHDFLFSKLTLAHLDIWSKEESEESKMNILASVELYVLACDILDDLQDMDTENSPWMKVEPKFAMNLVYLLLAMCRVFIMETTLEAKDKYFILESLALYEIKSVNGQNQALQKKWLTDQEYLQMIEQKSGSFVVVACLFGSYKSPKEKHSLIKEYSIHIGNSAQIENDLLGINEKYQYKDVVAKEISLPILYLLHFKKDETSLFYQYYIGNIQKVELLERQVELKNYIEQSGATEYSRFMQQIQIQKALSIIEQVYEEKEDRDSISTIFLSSRSK